MLPNPIHPWELTNKEYKPQIENVLDAVKKDIFKNITKLTFLKKVRRSSS